MSKTFTQAPKPKPLTADVIAAFEQHGTGQDTKNHITTNVVKHRSSFAKNQERKRRLSIDLPETLHRRFKTACSHADKKMLAEVIELIQRRTDELEQLKIP